MPDPVNSRFSLPEPLCRRVCCLLTLGTSALQILLTRSNPIELRTEGMLRYSEDTWSGSYSSISCSSSGNHLRDGLNGSNDMLAHLELIAARL